ncbi:MAG: ABC transporter ATP-binding protein [Nitrospirae bacterium]|nr:ABC transporter ATP-binding protein [Nitrospirota bacterium]
MQVFRKVVSLTRPYWPRVFAGILLSALLSGITGAIAWIVKPAVDEILGNKRYELIKFLAIGIVILFLLKGLIGFGQTYLMKSAGMKLVRDMRNRLYRHILDLPLSYFGRESSGITVSRVMFDVDSLSALVSNVIRNFVVEVPTVIVLIGVALYRKWDLTVITLVLLPFIALSTRKFGKKIKKKRKEAQKKLSHITQRIGETIVGIRIIKVFNRAESMTERFETEGQRYYRETLRVVRAKEFTNLSIDAVTGIGFALILLYGGLMVERAVMTPGDFFSVLTAIYLIFGPVKKIGDAYTTLQETRASIERIDTLLDAEHEERGTTVVDGFRKSLTFDRVSFAYPGNAQPVLSDISLSIRPGEVIAIVGRSGVGKSTLVDLIPRFNKASGGTIQLDGIDLNVVDIFSLRELIGIVSQDIILFDDTVRENIAFGRPGASEEEIVHAARLAFADEFIRELGDGYQTVIGERGLKLSGGQRQRIAIARAILKNPPILILDEATSSLDSVSEALVQKALETLMKERTTIVIAHRLSTIRNADRIVVLERGRIADTGNHEELMARSDTYMRLYNAFASGE